MSIQTNKPQGFLAGLQVVGELDVAGDIQVFSDLFVGPPGNTALVVTGATGSVFNKPITLNTAIAPAVYVGPTLEVGGAGGNASQVLFDFGAQPQPVSVGLYMCVDNVSSGVGLYPPLCVAFPVFWDGVTARNSLFGSWGNTPGLLVPSYTDGQVSSVAIGVINNGTAAQAKQVVVSASVVTGNGSTHTLSLYRVA